MATTKFRIWLGKEMLKWEDIGRDQLYTLLDKKHYDIMQWTGVHDKFGREIYDCDIVKVAVNPIELNGYRICEVVLFPWSGAKLFINGNRCAFGYHDDIEVIGNKYEHPHLKEKEGVWKNI
jgi:hypothetical protein